jgi:hypothetical protein
MRNARLKLFAMTTIALAAAWVFATNAFVVPEMTHPASMAAPHRGG